MGEYLYPDDFRALGKWNGVCGPMEEVVWGQDNWRPPTLRNRGLMASLRKKPASQLGSGSDIGSNAPHGVGLLSGKVFQDWLRNLDNVVANRVQHQLAQTVEIEFAHDVAAVCLRRLHAEVQYYGDFLCTLSLSEKLQDFPFTCCQPRQADLVR